MILISLFNKFSSSLDLILIVIMVYHIYKNVIGTYSLNIVKGLILIIAVGKLAYLLNLPTIIVMIDYLIKVLPIVFATLFGNEIKKIIIQIGQLRIPFKLFNKNNTKNSINNKSIEEIVRATSILSKQKIGSLICIEKKIKLNNLIESKITLNAEITKELILSIFRYGSSLHDGAITISDNKISSAKALLPLSNSKGLDQVLGTRHRAGLGISEKSDAIVIITSEETGKISFANKGKLITNSNIKDIKGKLFSYFMDD